MRLHYKPGACSMASHIALNETGLAFELDRTDTAAGRTERGGDFRDISPMGYVPALVTDQGDVITENPAVLQFVADLAPEAGLAPEHGTLARTRLHEMLNFVASELHKAFGPFFSGTELGPDERTRAEAGVARRIDHIERTLEDGRDFLLGGGFTIADAYAFTVLNWTGFVGIELALWPRTQAYVDRVRRRPSVANAMVAEGLIAEGAAA